LIAVNGAFSTVRLYRAFTSYSLVYVLENGSTLRLLGREQSINGRGHTDLDWNPQPNKNSFSLFYLGV